ncbi:MAG: PhnD/SsuA/transferrin family substrate-binding protein [Gammaproteobacteria bacterium]|nr:PhnD/SsuA/transferrin family substrate-binding protein [Gammaproteobacteria bacterium]MBU1416533.1 PhnD/SsuA/transferrin family substrate-binding protein [Gammaproteobacteria bacterium]
MNRVGKARFWPGRSVFAAIAALVMVNGNAAETATVADRWLINSGEHGEKDRFTLYPAWSRLIEATSGKAGINSMFVFSKSATEDLFATRGGTVAVIAGPAHIIGSALRYGHYQPIGVSNRRLGVVLATLMSSGIHSFADAKGKSLGVPGQDAIATYLMRGEANAAGTTLKQHFSMLYYTYYEGALLNALKFGTVDTVAVEDRMFEQWRAAGEPVVEVMRTRELPGLGVVAHKSLGRKAIDAMEDALVGKNVPSSDKSSGSFQRLDPRAYEYVATLGYFTPRVLEGAQLINAKKARELSLRGVAFFDGRTEEEYRTGHPAGARWLPYVERSTKETDYDASKDEFDVRQLPADKNQEVIFSCGGPECWKSYKSCRRAMKEGYKRVYWFRGGIKEWRDDGLPVEKG